MKNWNLTLIAAAVAFAAIALNANAGETLLSPRAKANQITTVSGLAENRLESNVQFVSPRGLANEVKVAKGRNDDRNLATENRNVIGSPKGLATSPKPEAR